MFNIIKKIFNRHKESNEINRKLDALLQKSDIFNDLFSKYITSMQKNSEMIKESFDKISNWQKVVYELEMKELINDLLSNGVRRIYGFVFVRSVDNLVRLYLIPSPNFETAHAISIQKIKEEGLNPEEWIMKGYHFIDIPKDVTELSEETIKKINKKHQIEKPIDVYIYDLKLAKDKFAETKEEKKVVEKIIKKIEYERDKIRN